MIAAAIGSLSCGSSSSGPNPPASPLAGHFVANDPFPTAGFALGLSLSVNGTSVSGYGWLGGLENPLTPLSVAGQFPDPAFNLTLTAQGGGSLGTLTGTVSGSTVQGTYTRATGLTPVPLTLVRADTGASGLYTSTITGATSEQPAAAAGFGVSQAGFLLTLAYPSRNFPLLSIFRSGSRPAAGSYPFDTGSGFAGTVTPAYAPNQRIFTITGGTVRIDVSTA